jgi:uncharacterized protein (UPF0332 family)
VIPKTKEKLEKEYIRCEKSYVKIDKNLFQEYLNLAYEDLDSAVRETNPRWAITKAYQSLFLMCNAILVKKIGIYSKDHHCLIVALANENLIKTPILNRIYELLKSKEKLFEGLKPEDALFEEISRLRIERNSYLYLPKTLRKITKTSRDILEEVRQLIKLLGEVE